MQSVPPRVKNFRTWLILDWKTTRFRVIKKKGKMKPTEIAIDLSLDVTVPEEVVLKASGSIELSTQKVTDIALEELAA